MRARFFAGVEYLAALTLVAAIVFTTLAVWEPIRVSGMSMSPALLPGDLAIVRRGAHPQEGSIALVRADGHAAVLHRVVAIGDDGIITTRGDANRVDDREPAAAREIAGVVVRVVPAGVWLRRWRPAE
jgi:signal peptidase I